MTIAVKQQNWDLMTHGKWNFKQPEREVRLETLDLSSTGEGLSNKNEDLAIGNSWLTSSSCVVGIDVETSYLLTVDAYFRVSAMAFCDLFLGVHAALNRKKAINGFVQLLL